MDARFLVLAGRTPIPNDRVPQQGNDNEDRGKETGGDILCFMQGIPKSHEPGGEEGPEIAVHMIVVLSIFLIIYWVNAVGSIVYPIGYMNRGEPFNDRNRVRKLFSRTNCQKIGHFTQIYL